MTPDIRRPIIINFKKLLGRAAIELAQKLNEVEERLLDRYDIILAVQAPDILEVCRCCKFKVFVQDTFSHPDHLFLNYLKGRGRIHPRLAGIILNHPEIKLPNYLLLENIKRAEELDIQQVICATTIEEALEMDKLSPHYIGLENEDLIGKDISFTDYCPEVLQIAKERVSSLILIGAGIKSVRDVRGVIDSGGAGVLISSLIIRSADPVNALNNLLY